MGEKTFLYAYDPTLKSRAVYIRKGNTCISLVSRHKFTLTKKEVVEMEKSRKCRLAMASKPKSESVGLKWLEDYCKEYERNRSQFPNTAFIWVDDLLSAVRVKAKKEDEK